jgi:hypothetical protein
MKTAGLAAVDRVVRSRRHERCGRRRCGAMVAHGVAAIMFVAVGAIWGPYEASAAESGASWRFAPAEAPPPPPGVAPAPYPVPLGQIGEISFWAPNRGLLITGGTEALGGPVPPGLYAYNGVGWHQLASVCGGAEGRIAWAGPDEFWTISDQRAGQLVVEQQSPVQLQSISLCHFLDGEVVGSYAMPLEQPDSYQKMDAAACYGPADCWFGGENGFHLHWNGSTLAEVEEPGDRPAGDMVNFGGQLYESVQLERNSAVLPEESTTEPPVLHAIALEGDSPIFAGVAAFSEVDGSDLPEYGKGVLPAALQAFALATDGSPLGANATQLWAAANPTSMVPSDSQPAAVTVLRESGGEWTQLTPTPSGESLLPAGVTLAGAEQTSVGEVFNERGAAETVAPEPGSRSAWLSLRGAGDGDRAEVARLEALSPQTPAQAPAKLVETDLLPQAGEQVRVSGEAGPIVCPAAHDCWMATAGEGGSTPGWLFHLTEDPAHPAQTDAYPEDTDPSFAGVIVYRPPDSGVPTIYPDLPPPDDSLANRQPASPVPPRALSARAATGGARKKAKPLIEHVKSMLQRHLLVISFTLTARAHVQLLARRGRTVVASTRRVSLHAGSHRLSLGLDPARWPTRLQFKATPIGALPAPKGGPEGTETNNHVET